MEYRCVHCGCKVKQLYIQYSPGNIRLKRCENCKEVADGYIECEIMILLIDLILQKHTAYSHLLFNTRKDFDFEAILWKLGLICLLLDACKMFLLKECKEDCGFSRSFELSVLACGKVLIHVILLNFVFLCVLLPATRILLTSSTETTSLGQRMTPVEYGAILRYHLIIALYKDGDHCSVCKKSDLDVFGDHAAHCSLKDIFLAIVVSSYFKIFLVALLIWEFPSSVPSVVDMLVLSSNAVALRVVTQSTTARCFLVCFSATAAKYLANHYLISVGGSSS